MRDPAVLAIYTLHLTAGELASIIAADAIGIGTPSRDADT